MDLDDIRLKDIEELNDDEKKVVNDSWGKLTKEEQEYYTPVHKTEGGGEGFKLDFKTQEEFDTYVAKKAQETIEQRDKERKLAKSKSKEGDDERFFPEGFKARDWNEAFKVALPKMTDKIVSSIQAMSQKQRDALDKVNKEFDQEYDTIAAKDKSVPAKGTQEREDWEAEIAGVGVKYKLHSMLDAYDVWKAVNAGKGNIGGDAAAIQTEGASRIANPKSVSRGYGSGNTPPKTRYFVGGGRRLDEIIEQRKREEGITD